MKKCFNCEKENDDSAAECITCDHPISDHLSLINEAEKKIVTGINKYDTIGGWLIVIAIGRVLGPILVLFSLFSFGRLLFSIEGYQALGNPDALSDYNRFAMTLGFNFVFSLIFLVIDIVLLYLLFRKKKLFPRMMIFYLLLSLVYSVINYLIPSATIGNNGVYATSLNKSGLAPAVILCLIWIPYYLISERVKGTFRH